MGHPAGNGHIQTGHIAELDRVIGIGVDRLGKILAHLGIHHIESCGELDIPDVIAPQVDVHQPWDAVGVFCVLVIGDSLHQGGCAVADADNRHADFTVICHIELLLVGK